MNIMSIMDNNSFLDVIKQSFLTFLKGFDNGKNGSRSNKKLEILHGAIAKDLSIRLGKQYTIQSVGFDLGKEATIAGRYIDKKVDITISHTHNNKTEVIAGIGIKFIMQNYAQNSNNYFENMLGETANIQCQNIPYFQIIILPDKMPYFKSGRKFDKWEIVNADKIKKYCILSQDPYEKYVHTPAKTLLYLISLYDLPNHNNDTLANNYEFFDFYEKQNQPIHTTQSAFQCETELEKFGQNVICNDYQQFIEKVVYRIKSI